MYIVRNHEPIEPRAALSYLTPVLIIAVLLANLAFFGLVAYATLIGTNNGALRAIVQAIGASGA